MNSNLMAQFPRSQREAIESAGYRIVRWVAARGVLQTRIKKGRIEGDLGEFLARWLPQASGFEADADLWLSFEHALNQTNLRLAGGSARLANSPLERALLHLPGLRAFWKQELRSQHFEALRTLVPQAWLLDPAKIPPGAVIQGLDTISWDMTEQKRGREWQIQDSEGVKREDWPATLAAHDGILSSRTISNVVLRAQYGRNDAGRLVLRTIEEAAP